MRNKVLIVCLAGAALPLVLAILTFGQPTDFNFFWDTSRAVLDGRSAYETWYRYPPHALFLFAPFALAPVWISFAIFSLLGTGLFAWAAKPYLPDDFPPYLPLITPAALFCLLFGQTGLIFGALWLWAFRGKWVAVSLLTFKPHLGVLSALSLNRRTIIPTAALAALLVALSAVVFGGWRDFFSVLHSQTELMATNRKWPYVGVSPGIAYGLYGWAVFGVAAAYLLSRRVDAFTAATAALLISPYGFHYDMPAASLGFAIALHKERSLPRMLAFSAALLVPVVIRLGAWIAPPILLWALWCQTMPKNGVGDRIGNIELSQWPAPVVPQKDASS